MSILETTAVIGSIVIPTFTFFYFINRMTIREIVRDELDNFKDKMNSPQGYRRSAQCDANMSPIREKLAHVESTLDKLIQAKLTK